MYESLYRTVNDSLKRQLVSIYKELCNDDGSLHITVVLQQRQKGTSDCGLFCAANAVALANGIDPSLVKWEQDKMRNHLDRCFLQKRMEMFPHETKHKHKVRICCEYSLHLFKAYPWCTDGSLQCLQQLVSTLCQTSCSTGYRSAICLHLL